MEKTVVEMRYCKGTRDLTFTVTALNHDGREYHQRISGTGYRWDGEDLTIINRGKDRFTFRNAVLR